MLSRFWYFVLAAVAAFSLATAFLVQASARRADDADIDQAIRRDRFEVELWLSLDDRARLDAIEPMTTHGDVRAALTEANGRAAGTSLAAGARQRMETTLTELNRQLAEGAADVLVALDRNGVIVAQVGGGAPTIDQSLRELDFVRGALEGQAKAAIWVRDGAPLRAASKPVMVAGNVVGAIVHAKTIDDDLARRLVSHVEGTSIGFFYSDRFLAAAEAEGTGGAASRDVLQTGLQAARANPDLRQTGRTQPTTLGERTQTIFALFPGQPADGALGFAVARPRRVVGSPFAAAASAPSDDVAGLPWPLLLGVPLLLALLGLVLTVVERDRPLAAFAAEIRKLAAGQSEKLASGSLKEQFRILAEDVNAGLERAAASASATQRKSTSLDELLGGQAAPSAPSFYAVPPAASAAPQPAPAPVAPPAPKPAPAAPPAPPAAPITAPPPAPSPQVAAAAVPVASQVPSQVVSLPPGSDYDDDDGATTVAQIPAELLSTLLQDGDEEAKHFRETYDEYIRVRTECGEPTAGLTYEKFEATLKKTKDQIVQKHGGSRVRFTVYVKDGKAALKAAPR